MGIDAGTPPGLWERVRKIAADEVAKFMRSGFLRNASITGGGLTIRGGGSLKVMHPESRGGGLGVYFGDTVSAITGNYQGTGLLVQDPAGLDIATFRSDENSGIPLAILWDGQQNNVVLTDNVTGQGLARPYIGGTGQPARYDDWTVQTSSTEFETVFTADGYHQHSGMLAWARCSTTAAGTTGEMRVMVDGQQLGDVAPVAFSIGRKLFGPATLDLPYSSFVTVEWQARVIDGAGALRVGTAGWVGRRDTV